MKVRPGAGEGLRLELDRTETGLLRELAQEMQVLLEAEIPRSDPVARRLMPAAYEDRAEQARYEEVVGDSLRTAKAESLAAMERALGSGGPVAIELSGDELAAWLSVIADLRLAIGTRLEVTEEVMAGDVDPSDPNAPALSVLHWLGWLQESMVEAAGWP